MQKKEFSIEIGGKKLTAEFTDLAEQANGSVIMKYGNTTALVTAVMSKGEKELDYMPLTVDYEERFYAAGEILGSRFIRREGRPTDEAVLSGRIVDRTIRPLFDQRMRRDVQVVITILSIDEDDPDILGVIGASLALGVSDIPWGGPVSAVRIGKLKDTNHLIINPIYKDRQENPEFEMDLVACGKDGLINMIEVGGKEVGEEVVTAALAEASTEIEKLEVWQKKIIAEVGKPKKTVPLPEVSEHIKVLFAEKCTPKMMEYVFGITPSQSPPLKGEEVKPQPGNAGIYELKGEWMAIAKEKYPDEAKFADRYYDEQVDELIHKEAIENGRRADGRAMDEIRPLFVKAGGVSPMLHGSGLFYRGGTHILSVLTLGGPGDAQIIDNMEIQETKKRFLHHYNFPPFSTGETGRIGSTNRRMIGHGALAEKALLAVIPPMEKFPYTIRLVSEAFSSNGSTSMGSVCGSTLALMDGGVPITAPVAGIASGLMLRQESTSNSQLPATSGDPKSQNINKSEYKILTDIQGPEDHHGDMDFKVAGTRKGITAVQMDVKVNGIPIPILAEAFEKARAARLKILEAIEKELAAPRADISPYAPKIITLKVKKDQIGLVIGGGGKTINGIKEKTGVDAIDIEEDGSIFISGKEGSAEKAAALIEALTHEYQRGERYEGEVVKLAEFGAFVSINSGSAEGMVHISEVAPFRIDRIESVLKVGQKVPVVVKEIDKERDRIRLSIKDADPNFIKRKAA